MIERGLMKIRLDRHSVSESEFDIYKQVLLVLFDECTEEKEGDVSLTLEQISARAKTTVQMADRARLFWRKAGVVKWDVRAGWPDWYTLLESPLEVLESERGGATGGEAQTQ